MCASGNVLQTHVLVATVFTSESCVQKNWKKYLFVIFVSFLLLSLTFVKYIFLLIFKKTMAESSEKCILFHFRN